MKTRSVMLFAAFDVNSDDWLAEFKRQGEDVDLRIWPAAGEEAEIDYVFAWNTPPGGWRRFSGLKAIFSLGAGVDRILSDPALPEGVPVVRMVDPGLVAGMREYVALHVLRHHRLLDELARQQADHEWRPIQAPLAGQRRVGVLGLGQLGGACAASLAALGFDVAGWTRTPRDAPGIATFSGPAGLAAIAARSEILVNLLPLTPATEGILNASLFEQMPRGAAIVNVGRGAHLVEPDLLSAMWTGQISGATLDVFRIEPLPPEHAFWDEPGITITPHNAAPTIPGSAVATLLANLRAFEAGEPVRDVVDRARGY